jgi:hypothetical protein
MYTYRKFIKGEYIADVYNDFDYDGIEYYEVVFYRRDKNNVDLKFICLENFEANSITGYIDDYVEDRIKELNLESIHSFIKEFNK